MLQEQLRCSLARLDGQLAGVAAGGTQQNAPGSTGSLASQMGEAVQSAAEWASRDESSAAAQPMRAAQQSQPAAVHQAEQVQDTAQEQLATSPAAMPEAGWQAALLPRAVEQQPLQWRPRRRSLAGALEAAHANLAPGATAAGAGTGAAADAVCHINIGNVGKPCPMPAAVLQPPGLAGLSTATHGLQQPAAAIASSKQQQPVLPPLRKEPLWPAGQQGKGSPRAPSAPMLRTAARAAARPTRMQPLQAGALPATEQQQQQQWQERWPGWDQQQQAQWPGWGQQQQQQAQAQWWQHFPPGWQQFQQPLQQWGAAAAGLAAGYGGAWHWAL